MFSFLVLYIYCLFGLFSGTCLVKCILCLAAAFPLACYWFSGNLSALRFKDGPGLVAGFVAFLSNAYLLIHCLCV